MFPTPRSFSHPLCEHSMSSRKQKTTTLLVRILKRKGSRGGFKELAGCRTPLRHSHSWLCSWVSFLRRVRWVPSSPLLRRPGLQPRRKPPQNNPFPNPFLRPNPRTGDFNRHERHLPAFLFAAGVGGPKRIVTALTRGKR